VNLVACQGEGFAEGHRGRPQGDDPSLPLPHPFRVGSFAAMLSSLGVQLGKVRVMVGCWEGVVKNSTASS